MLGLGRGINGRRAVRVVERDLSAQSGPCGLDTGFLAYCGQSLCSSSYRASRTKRLSTGQVRGLPRQGLIPACRFPGLGGGELAGGLGGLPDVFAGVRVQHELSTSLAGFLHCQVRVCEGELPGLDVVRQILSLLSKIDVRFLAYGGLGGLPFPVGVVVTSVLSLFALCLCPAT